MNWQLVVCSVSIASEPLAASHTASHTASDSVDSLLSEHPWAVDHVAISKEFGCYSRRGLRGFKNHALADPQIRTARCFW